jgi:hypothetical protein
MDGSILFLLQYPTHQTILFLVITLVVLILIRPKSADKVWQTATYIFAIFLLVNSLMIWNAPAPWRYVFTSIMCGVGYLISIAIIIAIYNRLLSVEKSEESAMGFIIWIYQPIGLLGILFIKWIVQEF